MRPEGVAQGGAHAPLMVQKGLRLLGGDPHVHHLPAHIQISHSCGNSHGWMTSRMGGEEGGGGGGGGEGGEGGREGGRGRRGGQRKGG